MESFHRGWVFWKDRGAWEKQVGRYTGVKYVIGDKVYCKRPGNKEWKGHNKVVGPDGKMVVRGRILWETLANFLAELSYTLKVQLNYIHKKLADSLAIFAVKFGRGCHLVFWLFIHESSEIHEKPIISLGYKDNFPSLQCVLP